MTETRKITLQFPSLRAFLAEYGERISAEGMLLRGEAPPAAGSTVDIEVVVAAGMRLLRARGETLWSGAAGAGSTQQAAAVRFQDLDEASRTLIAKIVDQRRREGAEPFQLADVPGPREARLRDLTVPAAAIGAEPVESAANAPEAIFDLAETPAAAATDLFAPLAAGEPAPPAPERKLKAPVPLLADPEPGPFDLGPPGAALDEALDEGLEAADLRPGAAPEEEAETATAAMVSDLSDLFGGDEPQMAPARGRTEAFPPSFVDEVEAELRATETPDSSYLDVDTSELELQLGVPLDEPEPPAERRAEPAPEPPMEPVSEAPVGVAPVPEPEIEVEPESAPEPEIEVKAESAPEPEVEIELEGAPEPEVEIELEGAPEPEVEIELEGAPEPEVEVEPELAPEPEVELSLEPEPQPEIVLQPEPEIGPETEPEPRPQPAPAPEPIPEPIPEPPLGASPRAAPQPELAARVAQAFDVAQGQETVEIPIIPPPAPPPTLPADRSAAPPPLAAAAAPPAAGPTRPAPAVLLDDNLLSIPELSPDPPSAAPLDEQRRAGVPADLPSSAQALRGAAGSSRHLGTWLLIGLLAVALAVAGYLLWGLARDDGGFLQPADRASVPVPPPPSAAGPAEPDAVPAPGVEPAAAAPVQQPVQQPAPAAPVATDPPALLTGLDRITWNEIGSETVLALIGDGAIERRAVELVTIGGDQPRLVIKVSGVQRAFQPAVLEVGTTQVDRVRTGLHADGELHVVIDLAAAGVAVRDLALDGPRLELRLGTE